MKKKLMNITKNYTNEELKELLKDISFKLKHSTVLINILQNKEN